MKSLLPYLIVFVASLVVVTAVMAGLVKFTPGIFRTAGTEAAPSDSTKGMAKDSLGAASGKQGPATDTTETSDKDASEKTPPQSEPAQAQQAPHDTAQAPAPIVTQQVNTDSVDTGKHQEAAKFFDSMNAESAVKILNGMNDNEIKGILAKVKKRQAAKILSLLDPSRAARVLR